MAKRLTKSRKGMVLLGVAGGLAEYLDVDPVFVRVIFVVTCFAGGAGFLAYIILAFVMPWEELPEADASGIPDRAPEPPEVESRAEPDGRVAGRRNAVGLAFVAVGALLLLTNFGLLSWLAWAWLWPVALIALGVVIIVGRLGRS